MKALANSADNLEPWNVCVSVQGPPTGGRGFFGHGWALKTKETWLEKPRNRWKDIERNPKAASNST